MLGNLQKFVGFVYHRFPLSWLTLSLTLISLFVEYATFSLMLPLSGQAPENSMVYAFWARVANLLGAVVDTQTWLWIFLLLLAIRISLAYVLTWLNTLLSKRVHAFLSDKIFGRVVQDEPLAEIYRRSIGFYVSLAGDETHRAGNIIFNFGQLIAAVLSACAGLVLIFLFSRSVFFGTVLFVAISLFLVYLLLNRVVAESYGSTLQSRDLNTYFIDALNGIRSLRSMAVEPYIVRNYREKIARYVMALLKIDLMNQAMKSGPALMLVVVGIVWLWPGQNMAAQSHAPMYFVAVATLLIRLFTSLGAVVTTGGRLVTDVRAVHDIDELTAESTKVLKAGAFETLQGPIASIVISDVACGFKKGSEILTHVSGEFRAGRVYAIVGESGSGKSTLADVILGLLPAERGAVLFNGVSLSRIQADVLRKRVVLVEQQTRIFTGSFRDNVLLGYEATEEEISTALAVSGLADFVSSLPNGLDSLLEYQGFNLSGGQRQRIGIARAVIRKPEVLILDEATSALDQNMRNALIREVRRLMREGILILITHDQEIVTISDEIWQVKGGRIHTPVGAA